MSVETRDRFRALGGATHEEAIVAAPDALESERFWAEAEAGKRWFDSLPEDERARHLAEDAEIDALFKGL